MSFSGNTHHVDLTRSVLHAHRVTSSTHKSSKYKEELVFHLVLFFSPSPLSSSINVRITSIERQERVGLVRVNVHSWIIFFLDSLCVYRPLFLSLSLCSSSASSGRILLSVGTNFSRHVRGCRICVGPGRRKREFGAAQLELYRLPLSRRRVFQEPQIMTRRIPGEWKRKEWNETEKVNSLQL